MKYSDLIKKEEEFDKSQPNLKKYETEALEYISSLVKLDDIQGDEFKHLYSDLTDRACQISFETVLPRKAFSNASEFAMRCLHISLNKININPMRAREWTWNALKCFDHILIHYVNDILNEIIPENKDNWLKETYVYSFLSDKGGEIGEVGDNFIYIYQLRSKFEHITKRRTRDRKVEIRPLTKQKKREHLTSILRLFKEALEKLEGIFLVLLNTRTNSAN